MTDEERQKLVEKLKESTDMKVSYWTCLRAANEIERLATENKKLQNRLIEYVAESNAEFFFASFPEKRSDWVEND